MNCARPRNSACFSATIIWRSPDQKRNVSGGFLDFLEICSKISTQWLENFFEFQKMKDSHLKDSIFGLDIFISCQRIITLSLGSVHKSKTCVSLQGRCGLPPPHLVEFTPYVLQYRYEGDLLDSNGGQTRGAVLSFMEEYGIQKKTLDFVLKISVFGARSHRLWGHSMVMNCARPRNSAFFSDTIIWRSPEQKRNVLGGFSNFLEICSKIST